MSAYFSTDIIIAVASSITSLTLLVIVWQVKANHDKARRERALDLLTQWDAIRHVNSFRHERLMFELSALDVARIQKGQELEITKEIATKHLPDLSPNTEGKYILDVKTVLEIRLTMLTLLNMIENIALAYKHNVADRKILDDAYYNILVVVSQ